MTRKVIIRKEDFHREAHFFLGAVGADIPVHWSAEALTLVKDATIEAYRNMGIQLEVSEGLPVSTRPLGGRVYRVGRAHRSVR